jgi:hypothetical protein
VQYDDNTIVEACKRYLGWTSSLWLLTLR